MEEEEEEDDFGKEALVQKQGAQLARRGITFEAKGGQVGAAGLKPSCPIPLSTEGMRLQEK